MLVHDAETVRVQWYEGPRGFRKPRTRDWPNNPASRAMAKEWAKGFAEARILPPAATQLTLRQLWERYAEAQFPQLRAKSQKIYTEYWTLWERMWGRDFAAAAALLADAPASVVAVEVNVSCPNLEDQAGIWVLLRPEDIGVNLTEGMMMDPEASVSALVFHHPDCTYFSVGEQSLPS